MTTEGATATAEATAKATTEADPYGMTTRKAKAKAKAKARARATATKEATETVRANWEGKKKAVPLPGGRAALSCSGGRARRDYWRVSLAEGAVPVKV